VRRVTGEEEAVIVGSFCGVPAICQPWVEMTIKKQLIPVTREGAPKPNANHIMYVNCIVLMVSVSAV
jgi:hypothetical protein